MRRLIAALGMDRAVLYTVLWRAWSAIVAPVNLLVVTLFLTPVQQGFFYTFGSILQLQIIFELGLSQLILQFASHERAVLEWGPDLTLTGDRAALSRLASLLRSASRWYGTAALLVVGLVLPVGFWLFGLRSSEHLEVGWQAPWILFILLEAVSFTLLPMLAVLEGCGRVADVALMRFAQIATGSALMWLVLWRGGGLYGLVAIKAAEVVWALGWLGARYRPLLRELLWEIPLQAVIDWRREIWPIQWRIALTWVSSLLITPLFNPLLFALEGPEAAGRMGLSVSVMATINTVGLAWINTKAPTFGVLIARRDWRQLDRLFFPALVKSTVIVVAACVTIMAGVLYLNHIGHHWAGRVLAPLPFGLLLLTAVVLHLIFAEAVYLRAHKAEPFMPIAVTVSLATGASSYLLGRVYGATGVCAGYLACMAVYLVVGTQIFHRKRHEWHGEAPLGLAVEPASSSETV